MSIKRWLWGSGWGCSTGTGWEGMLLRAAPWSGSGGSIHITVCMSRPHLGYCLPRLHHPQEPGIWLGAEPRWAAHHLLPHALQGSGRYAIYIANYAHGNVGPDALIEMDPEASDLSRGILALRDVAAEAGVSKYTGMRGAQVGWEQGVGGPASWDLSPWSLHEAGVSREGHRSTLFDLLPLSPSVQCLVDSGRCKPWRTQ